MKAIQVTVDEPLLEQVDAVVRELDTTRSAFLREALALALRRHRTRKLEREHKEGYERIPQNPDDLAALEMIQSWGDQ